MSMSFTHMPMASGGRGSQGRGPWLWPIRVVAFVLCAAVLVAGALSVVAFFFVRTATETTAVSESLTRLRVTAATGDIRVRQVAPGEGVSVIAHTRSSFRTAGHRVSASDGVLEVAGSCTGGFFIADSCSVDFEITVPPGVAVEATSATGDVHVERVGGSVDASADSGEVRVIGGSGRIRLSSATGDVTASDLAGGEASARTDAGDVRLAFVAPPSRAEAVTSTGDVRVVLPPVIGAYRVEAQTSTGDRRVDVPTDPASGRVVLARTGSGDVRVLATP